MSRDATRYPRLFAPLALGAMRLRNRIAHASMTTRMSAARRVTESLVNYYASRARGGAALIVTEPVSAARFQLAAHKVRVWSDDDVAGLSRWADGVEREDCRLLAQFQDPGRGRHERGRNPDAVGASALPDDLSWTVPHVLTAADIAQMVGDFADSACRLQRCGFSGVELSAAHGHLFHQFMSPWMNRREDGYGGDLPARCRIVTEIVAAIRQSCGARFLIGVKMPADDGIDGSIGPTEAAAMARHFVGFGGVDYLCFAQGAHAASLDRHVPDLHGPRAPYVPLIERLKAAVPDTPVMALGLITDPAEADAILARGAADLIGLGRPLVTDAAWGLKAGQGREADIRYCVSCNSCWAAITEHRPLACDNNPRVGLADEVDWWPAPVPAALRKRVVVVGTGIAGMEAAWIAAARGHEVIAFGAGSSPGGKTRLFSRLPGGEALSSIYDYQTLAAKKARLRLELGVRAGAADVSSLDPDVLILATGSSMGWPAGFPRAWQADGLVSDLRNCMEQLLDLTQPQGGTAVLWDMDATEGTYAAAQVLRRLFDRVVIATPRDRIAEDVPLVNRLGILRRFAQLRIESAVLCSIDRDSPLEDAVVGLRNLYTGAVVTLEDVALLTYATPRVPTLDRLEEWRHCAPAVHVVGDAYAPGSVMAATAQGHRAGNRV